MRRVFTSDCEGPITKDDNARDLAVHYVPNGGNVFDNISKYDDVEADVVKRRGYKAGDTLRLILPFLKAYGATNKGMEVFSNMHITMLAGAKDTLKFVKSRMPSFVISTSYEPYIRAVCHITEFPLDHAYCTKVDLDKFKVGKRETNKLRKIAEEIGLMEKIVIPDGAKSVAEFSEKDRKSVERLDEIFWEDISGMESGRMLDEVNPIGGFEKANAVKDIAKKTGVHLDQLMYTGDSITDTQAFQLVGDGGGLTVSFNGNGYAIREADIAVLSPHTIITSIIADVFKSRGRDEVFDMLDLWDYHSIEVYSSPELLRSAKRIFRKKRLPQVEIINDENMERLTKESSAFRKEVRGVAVGTLG